MSRLGIATGDMHVAFHSKKKIEPPGKTGKDRSGIPGLNNVMNYREQAAELQLK